MNAQSPKIALVTPMLPMPHDHSRGRYIHEIAKSLATLTPTRVFFQQQRYPSAKWLQPRSYLYKLADMNYQIDGIDVEAFSYPTLPIVSRPFNGIVSKLTLTPRLAVYKPDVVLSYWIYPDGAGATYAAHALGIPSVVGALGSDVYIRDRLNAWLTRKTLNKADAILAVAEQMRRTIITKYNVPTDRVHTIINGFNTDIFYPRNKDKMRNHLGISQDAKVITYVGRLVEAKGIRELLAAFSRLAANMPTLTLILIGDGVMRPELEAMVNSNPHSQRILLPGTQPPERVAEWLGASDALCLPSWSEGYPNVVVEAIACGRPAIATDVGGTREIINQENGILIPPRNVDSICHAIKKVVSMSWDDLAMAQAIKRSWEDVARETLDICKNVIHSHAH